MVFRIFKIILLSSLPDRVGLGTDAVEAMNVFDFPFPLFKTFPKSSEISQKGSIVVDTLLQT
jgi:hypothetical protein